MRRMHVALAALIAALTIWNVKASAQVTTTASVVSTVQTYLKAFYTSKRIEDVQAAADALETGGPARSSVTSLSQARNTLLRGWLSLFEAIDWSEDPAYDLHDIKQLPAVCLTPPIEADGTGMPSCANPSDVKDPVARAVYQKELDENARKTLRVNLQSSLRTIDSAAMLEVHGMLSELRPSNGEDISTLTHLIDASAISPIRKAKLKTML